MVLETHMRLCVTESDFLKKRFLLQKWAKNGLKIVILDLLQNFVISFFSIWSIMKRLIISYIPVQVPSI